MFPVSHTSQTEMSDLRLRREGNTQRFIYMFRFVNKFQTGFGFYKQVEGRKIQKQKRKSGRTPFYYDEYCVALIRERIDYSFGGIHLVDRL